jgi:2-keto-4-pentenoate hydratase
MTDDRVARGMRALLDLRRERIAGGERPIGWKVGLGSAPAKELLGLTEPLVGFLTDAGLLENGARCSLEGWASPVLEAEIAAYAGEDGQIAGLGAAIELADVDSPPTDPEQVLAGNVFHRRVILGPVDASRLSAEGVGARVLLNGVEVAATDEPEVLNGRVADNVRHVADVLAACGERLRAGEVVITGAVVPPLPVRPGESWLVELPPLGSLAVRFD